MSDALEHYQELSELIKRKQQERDQAKGALKQLLKQLDKEHNCTSLEVAKRKVKKLEADEKELEEKLSSGLDKLQKKLEQSLKDDE